MSSSSPQPQPRLPRDAWRKAPLILLALLVLGAAFAAPFAVSAVLDDDAAPAARPPATSLEAELGGATPIDAPEDVKASTLGAAPALPALLRPRPRRTPSPDPAPAPAAPTPVPTAESTPVPTAAPAPPPPAPTPAPPPPPPPPPAPTEEPESFDDSGPASSFDSEG